MNWKKLRDFFFKPKQVRGRFVGRHRTHDDTAIKYRMGAGYAGSVTRTHPVDIQGFFPDATNPPQFYGQATQVDGTSHSVRAMLATDNSADTIFGIVVRPHPVQQDTTSSSFGQTTLGGYVKPQTVTVQDVCRKGFILVPVQGTPVLGGRVYVWAAANSGSHVLGGFEADACYQKTVQLDEKSYFNGTKDTNGVVEIGFNI